MSLSERWLYVEAGARRASENMAYDELLLEIATEKQAPVLRFYSWAEAAASFGYFQRYELVARVTGLRPLVRRPTGGGVVPHDADWTYSLAFPATHSWYGLKARESYERMHAWVQAAFQSSGLSTQLATTAYHSAPGQCFAGAEQFDVLWHGRKIAGAAQRRTRQGLLIQGSVQPAEGAWSRAAWQEAMLAVARERWNTEWQPLPSSSQFEDQVRKLAEEKYGRDAFTRRL